MVKLHPRQQRRSHPDSPCLHPELTTTTDHTGPIKITCSGSRVKPPGMKVPASAFTPLSITPQSQCQPLGDRAEDKGPSYLRGLKFFSRFSS